MTTHKQSMSEAGMVSMRDTDYFSLALAPGEQSVSPQSEPKAVSPVCFRAGRGPAAKEPALFCSQRHPDISLHAADVCLCLFSFLLVLPSGLRHR